MRRRYKVQRTAAAPTPRQTFILITHSNSPLSISAFPPENNNIMASRDHIPSQDSDRPFKGDDDGAVEAQTQAPMQMDQLDGGRYAWQSVIASFATLFIVFGIQTSYGVFLAWYSKHDFPNASTTQLTLVGSLNPGVMFVSGLFVGRIAETVGFRPVMAAGCVLMTVGLLLASFATQVWQLALTQGAMCGLGAALVFFPGVSLPSQWWLKRRSLAMGLSMAGSGVGGLAVVNIATALLPSVGSAWTLRVLAATSGVMLALATVMAETRVPKRTIANGGRASALIDFELFRDRRFLAMVFASLVVPFGMLTPYFYLPTYTVAIAQSTPAFASLLLTILNVFSIAGRIISGAVADHIGNINTYILTTVATGAVTLAMWLPAGTSQPILAVYAAAFGFFSGGFVAQMPPIMAQQFGIAKLPSILGLMYAAFAAGNLAGGPVAGAIVEASAGSTVFPSLQFGWGILYTGLVWIVGAAGAMYLRFGLLDSAVWKAY
ncbi:major facilitator superfamily domain-containing protein [Blastocladiella britannica]|nr:major facilitator superfamily domain-containing protein [Blastocladiella britannica]